MFSLLSRPEAPPLAPLNYINLLAYVANAAVTYLSLTGLFGPTNTELSKKYQTLFTPAGWAFAIWGVIFIWEAIAVVAQMLPAYRDSEAVKRISYWWAFACLSQIVWTPVFAQEVIWLSLVCMLSILLGLAGLAYQLYDQRMSYSTFWLIKAPFAVHLGWIVAASAVNTNVVFQAYGASSEVQLAVAVASFAVVFSAGIFCVTLHEPNVFVSAVVAWALGAQAFELAGKGGAEFDAITEAFPALVTNGLSAATAALSIAMASLTVLRAVVFSIQMLTQREAPRRPSLAEPLV